MHWQKAYLVKKNLSSLKWKPQINGLNFSHQLTESFFKHFPLSSSSLEAELKHLIKGSWNRARAQIKTVE